MKYDVNDLVEMLSYRRGAGTPGEEAFIKRYIDSVHGMKKDGYGNRYIKIGNSDVAFACHTDTVHSRKSTFNLKGTTYNIDKLLGTRQEVVRKGKWASKDDGQILGADDTTGIWICLNLLHKRVPGLYIFHRDEEIGGKGSDWIVSKTPELVEGINKMISFDRKGYGSVITKQRWSRTCSDEFGNALASAIGGGFDLDEKGVFTDSANYKELIPECTNVSIGYFSGHSADEKQDLVFAHSLMERLLRVNWDALPAVRDPTPVKPAYKGYTRTWGSYEDDFSYGYGGGYGGYGGYNTGYGGLPYQGGHGYSTSGSKMKVKCEACGASWSSSVFPKMCPYCYSSNIVKLVNNKKSQQTTIKTAVVKTSMSLYDWREDYEKKKKEKKQPSKFLGDDFIDYGYW